MIHAFYCQKHSQVQQRLKALYFFTTPCKNKSLIAVYTLTIFSERFFVFASLIYFLFFEPCYNSPTVIHCLFLIAGRFI